MWRILFLTLFLFSSVAFAQTQEKPKARINDLAIGNFNSCPPYLDNLIYSMAIEPESSGVIITYQSVNALPSNYDSPIMFKELKKFILFRRYDSSRLKVIFGGFRSEIQTEFWLVPQGAEEPIPSNTLPKPTIPTDKTFLYDQSYFGYECFDCGIMFELLSTSAQKERIKLEKESEEEDKKNGIETDKTEDEPTYSKEELEEMKFYWVESKFGEVINSQKDSIGTIIFYGDEKEYNIRAVRAHVEQGKKRIVKEAQISPNQIRIVYGGYRESLEAEFWITPKGAILPTPKPEKREVADSNQ